MLRTYPHQRAVFTTYEGTTLGKLVTLALRKSAYQERNNNDQQRNRPMVTITLRLTSAQLNSRPRLYKLMRLNLDIDDVFKQHLLVWIAAYNTLGVGAQPACRSFLEYFDIDETEYSLGAAYKHWQRAFRKKFLT